MIIICKSLGYREQTMKQITILLIFFLILGLACSNNWRPIQSEESDEELVITLENAVERGFPVYLPSDDMLQSVGIVNPPTVILKTQDKTCSYLEIHFKYEDEADNNTAMLMQVSNGCAFPFWRDASEVELQWANEGKAWYLGEDKESPVVVFDEPTHQFLYVVFSEEPLSTTLEILESMD
jgi:hypothetical protein